jgi:transcriptional regulator with XRE-family HTH domain
MKISIRNTLGKKIKHYRNERGYTQVKLSELANIDYKYLQRIEGSNPPAVKIDTIEKLSKALNVSPSKLL